MQGLLFNLLAEMALSTECEAEVWEVVLACADSPSLWDELDDWDPDVLRLPELDMASGALFRCLIRSALPFSEADWNDMPGTSLAGGAPAEPLAGDEHAKIALLELGYLLSRSGGSK